MRKQRMQQNFWGKFRIKFFPAKNKAIHLPLYIESLSSFPFGLTIHLTLESFIEMLINWNCEKVLNTWLAIYVQTWHCRSL